MEIPKTLMPNGFHRSTIEESRSKTFNVSYDGQDKIDMARTLLKYLSRMIQLVTCLW